jgi:Arc/MetJ-type ribon-helix-helix transcriptional regulator
MTIEVNLGQDQLAYMQGLIAAGKFDDLSSCVASFVEEGIRAAQRRDIDAKLLEALDQDEKGQSLPWTKEDRRAAREAVARKSSTQS